MISMTMTQQRPSLGDPQSRVDDGAGGVTPYSEFAPEYRVVIERLRHIRELPEGWDTYGSRAVQTSALAMAVAVLVAASAAGMPAPFVGPVSGGGLQFDWTTARGDLEIEVLPDGFLRYLLCLEGQPEVESSLSRSGLQDIFGRAQGREAAAA